MDTPFRRRDFLRTGAALGLGAGLVPSALGLGPRSAAEMVVRPESVQLRPEIEPIVRLIESCPRDRAIDLVLARLREGLPYRDLMAGLFLAGIRNVKPRPVGFKFHAVLVINSAHLLAQAAADEDRLLPMLWALDNFKASQAQDEREGDWTLGPVDEGRVPDPASAATRLAEAMESWDSEAADAATAALCRTQGASGAMEPFWRYGLRDHRNIGHKAIFAAQSWRTLQAIGWRNAEPVLRSLSFGLLDLEGSSDRTPLGPYAANLENAAKVRAGWQAGRADAGATQALLETLRHASPEAASAAVRDALNAGVAADSLWDAVILRGNEMLLRNPGIVAIHAVTSANALHFIYGASGDDNTRKLALLQAAGWMPLYRGEADARGSLRLDAIEPAKSEGKTPAEALAGIFAGSEQDRIGAAARAVGYLRDGGTAEAFFATARRLIFHKAQDSHDYKYVAAAWEESRLASDPRWHAPLVAATVAHLPGSDTSDSPLMVRAREAVGRVLGPKR